MDADCKEVHQFNDSWAKCEFVKNNSNCQDSDGYLNYVEILYCDFSHVYLALILYALWLLVLFIGLGATADDYFCPNLAIISKTCR